jgi:hypothetical protein
VRIAGAGFGADRDLIVSPQHGVLMASKSAPGDQQLIRATHLARARGGAARVMQGCRQITYVHILFEEHQIVFSNGIPSESFFPGPQALKALDRPKLTEMREIFPDLVDAVDPTRVYSKPSRPYSRWKAMPRHLGELRIPR